MGPSEPDLFCSNCLLKVMSGEANSPLRQKQAKLGAHGAIEPRVGRGSFGPAALVEPSKNKEINALHTGLKRAPDEHARMCCFAAADFA